VASVFRDPLRILFVAPYVPSLVRPRPFQFVKGLLERGHAVDVVALASTREEGRAAGRLRELGAGVHVVRPRLRLSRAAGPWLAGGLPLHVAYCRSARMSDCLAGLFSGGERRFDVVHVEHVRAALYGRDLPAAVKVFDAVDCHSRLLEAAAAGAPTLWEKLWARADLQRTRALERALLGEYAAVLVSSDADRRSLQELRPAHDGARLQVVAHGVDLGYFRPVPNGDRSSDTLVFVGRLGYHANRRALQRLLFEIMPLVWRQRPRVRLLIVGEGPPGFVRRAAAREPGRVVVSGSVPDVRPYLAQACVAVCPMPYAVGLQNKVLEAMATETALVADPPAAPPGVESGEQLLVARGSEDFASCVLRLLCDGELRSRIGRNGRAYVEKHHRWDDALARLEAIYAEQIASRCAAPAERP
jgi:glycosyltransferase involved in cell wall biosynthesis